MLYSPDPFDGSLPGDVILYPVTPRSEFISRLVVAGQMLLGLGKGMEGYSHVAVVSDRPNFQYEAKFPFVGEFPVDKKRVYEIWRVCELTDDQRSGILNECRRHVGDMYNLTGLFTDGRFVLPHTEVCSELFDKAYTRGARVRLSHGGGKILSPNVIPDHPGARMLRRYTPLRKR